MAKGTLEVSNTKETGKTHEGPVPLLQARDKGLYPLIGNEE